MMRIEIVIVAVIGLFCLFEAGNAVAKSKEARDSSGVLYQGTELQYSGDDMNEKNHQQSILSNPRTSGAARAEKATAGGNTAIINQNGANNASSIIQNGDDNVAEQTQIGIDNELRVEQNGKNNSSRETQIGKRNKKIKIQNGNETMLEQVKP